MILPNLIGITGRIGSGKDTVAQIIQYLTLDPQVFSMQNTSILADLEHRAYCAKKSRYQIKKYAGKLKDVAAMLTGIPVHKFEDQAFKNTKLGEEWNYQIDQFNTPTEMTVRQLLQKLGTEAMREGLHPDVWVNALFADYTLLDHWIITDVRFPNEVQELIRRKGVLIQVVRPNNPHPVSDHPSETALNDYLFPYTIVNDGDLNDLINKVRALLVQIQTEQSVWS